MRLFTAVAVLSLVTFGTALAEAPPPITADPDGEPPSPLEMPDVGGVGEVADLAPGDRAPEFDVASSSGGRVRFADLLGKMSILLFARDCGHFAPLSAACDSLAAIGVHAYGVCEGSEKVVAADAARPNLSFPVLSDPNAQLAKGFGMFDAVDQAVRPGFVLLNEKGVVRVLVQTPSVSPEGMVHTVRQALGLPGGLTGRHGR